MFSEDFGWKCEEFYASRISSFLKLLKFFNIFVFSQRSCRANCLNGVSKGENLWNYNVITVKTFFFLLPNFQLEFFWMEWMDGSVLRSEFGSVFSQWESTDLDCLYVACAQLISFNNPPQLNRSGWTFLIDFYWLIYANLSSHLRPFIQWSIFANGAHHAGQWHCVLQKRTK